MSAEKLAMVDQAAQATRAAKAHGHADINSLVAPCPASQAELFVVPVRYALAEAQAAHPACAPGVNPQSRPMAVRRLRGGFIYVWQHEGPLKRYAVSPKGLLEEQALDEDSTMILGASLTGLALDKIHDAWMLYSEFPLDAQHCQSLSDSSAKRSEHMRHIALRTVAGELQATHCPPLADADEVMAELDTDSYARAMKADHQRGAEDIDALRATVMKDPTPANIKAYADAMHRIRERETIIARHPEAGDQPPGQWSAEPWDAQGTRDWLENVRDEAQGLYAVFACLDDDLGVLRDINHEQEQLEAEHEQWLGDHHLRLSVGGFIRSLVTEDGAELAGSINYRYKEHALTLTPDQGRTLLDAQRRLDLNKELQAETHARRYGGHPTRAEAAARDARIANILAPVRAFIPEHLHHEIEHVVRQYSAEKQDNLNNAAFSAKVAEYIDLDVMNSWFEQTAGAHFEHLEQRHTLLFADRGLYLRRSASGTWFVDYDDLDTRQWLTELAHGCLTAQCLRAQGAEQYADYVRAADGGALAQLFNAWTPSLDAIIVTTSRLNELLAALSSENINATYQAMAPVGRPVLNDIATMAQDAHSRWSSLVNRLAPALLQLNDKAAPGMRWLGIVLAARLSSETRLQYVIENGRYMWKLQGEHVQAVYKWAADTGRAIGAGHVERIVKSPFVVNSGGVVPLLVLLANVFNTLNYLEQAKTLEGMDPQRINDTVSSSLNTTAALVSVVGSQVRMGFGRDRFHLFGSAASTLTLFGGVIGGLSAAAAFAEFKSLKIQLEQSQTHLDPWLDIRQNVVGGQIAAFGTQALLGVSYTMRTLAGSITVETAILRYTLYMGPVNWILLALGTLYMISWSLQQTPLQNFLNHCCWAKGRADDQAPIAPKAQQAELDRLYAILYTPRVSMKSSTLIEDGTGPSGLKFSSAINALTIDLPGANPDNVYLELSLIGDPVDTQLYRKQLKRKWTQIDRPRPWRDMAQLWLADSTCQWIPYKEGQGLRLSGPFNTVPGELGSPPATVSLRLWYRTPLLGLLGANAFIGGQRGVAFTLNDNTGVIMLRNDPTPELDRAKRYPLSREHPDGIYLQPEVNA